MITQLLLICRFILGTGVNCTGESTQWTQDALATFCEYRGSAESETLFFAYARRDELTENRKIFQSSVTADE